MSSQTNVQINTQRDASKAKSDLSVQFNTEVSPEQKKYANILLFCSWAGIILMAITFVLYMTGSMNPLTEPSQIPLYWGLNVHDFQAATHAPTGWGWLSFLNHADYLNLVGLAFLGIVSTIGYLVLFVEYLRKKDLPYVLMVSVEVVVIVLAASGIVSAG